MRLAPLYDLQQEINRLFIAGSKFSKGDPRLLKQVPIFQKLGEKAPVFKKIATDIEALANGETLDAANKLMELSSVLYAVLYTQGETIVQDASIKNQKPEFDIHKIDTQKSYLQLKPVIDALSSSKSGRLEVLKDAMKERIFDDFRTYHFLDFALGDRYSELADYVYETILPSIGTQIIPILLKSFKYEDKTEHVRRLAILHKLSYEGIPDMITKILSESLPNLQAKSIEILSEDIQNEALIIKLADDKNKIVREACYEALIKYNTELSLAKITSDYKKSKSKVNNEGLTYAIAKSNFPFYFKELLDQYAEILEIINTKKIDEDEKAVLNAIEKLSNDVKIFNHKDQPEVYELFKKIIFNENINELIKTKKSALGSNIHYLCNGISNALSTFDKQKALRFYEEIIPKLNKTIWIQEFYDDYFLTAVAGGYDKVKLYDTFEEAFKKEWIYTQSLQNLFEREDEEAQYAYIDRPLKTEEKILIDSRWESFLYDKIKQGTKYSYDNQQIIRLLNAILPLKDKQFESLLLSFLDKYGLNEVYYLFDYIIDRDLPNKFEVIYQALDKFKKKNQYYYFYNLEHKDIWEQFPSEYGAKIRAIGEREKVDLFNTIADKIEHK